tara:strand:- start:184 stop:1053 length:870 start_codon:yes stop_codon:yes gene_type:complete
MKKLFTSSLEVAILERGPVDGRVVFFLHGFPDDATGFLPIMNVLADQGIRTIAPYMRGFGPTTFRDEAIPRLGDTASLMMDVLEIMDALGVDNATFAGHGWGARIAQGLAALYPEHVERLLTFGGYAIAPPNKDLLPTYSVLQKHWFEHLLNTPYAERILEEDMERFAKYLWAIWSPGWDATEREIALAGVVKSFLTPDFVEIVLSAYTGKRSNPRLFDVQAALSERPKVTVPTTIIRGGQDPLETPTHIAKDEVCFTSIKQKITWPKVGNFAHREKPAAVAKVLLNMM